MKFFFSGIDSVKTYALLEKAGVRFVLVDQFDVGNVPRCRAGTMLDSGAYRAWKNGWTLSLGFYAEITREFSPFDQITTLDVFGNNQATYENWMRLRCDHNLVAMPVWFFSDNAEDEKLLHKYMLWSNTVGIGGLVPKMRAKDQEMLQNLDYLCSLYPKRFHIFGLNWLHAIKVLKHKIFSADSSKWLDGARYRHLIYFDSSLNELVQTKSSLSREEICILNAMNIEAYILGLPGPLPEEQRPKWSERAKTRRYVINRNRKFQR